MNTSASAFPTGSNQPRPAKRTDGPCGTHQYGAAHRSTATPSAYHSPARGLSSASASQATSRIIQMKWCDQDTGLASDSVASTTSSPRTGDDRR